MYLYECLTSTECKTYRAVLLSRLSCGLKKIKKEKGGEGRGKETSDPKGPCDSYLDNLINFLM